MNEKYKSGRLTGSERLTATFLRWATWLSFFLIALPAPLYFLFRYFTATEDVAVYMLLVLTSLAVGSIAGLITVALFLLYRRNWERKLRDRLATDGITTDELSWFTAEMTAAERRALKQISEQNALLADAYRETLAARLTAARVIANTKREATLVERRLEAASRLEATERASLEKELRADQARLKRVEQDALAHRAEAEARLQMIEATATRGANEAETELALLRLDVARGQVPLGLEAARLEREAREELKSNGL